MPSVHAWLQHATARLVRAGVPSARTDARELLKSVLGLDDTAFFVRLPAEVPAPHAEQLVRLIEARASRIPLQHLLGEVEWGGVRLRTDARALIPRPETEWLLHLVLQNLPGVAAPRVLDVGTGTGALALGLKAARPGAAVTASDLSAEALTLARANAELNGLDVTFIHGHLLAGLLGPFDLILSNPPYLPEADRAGADPEVRFDPIWPCTPGRTGWTWRVLSRRRRAWPWHPAGHSGWNSIPAMPPRSRGNCSGRAGGPRCCPTSPGGSASCGPAPLGPDSRSVSAALPLRLAGPSCPPRLTCGLRRRGPLGRQGAVFLANAVR